MLTLITNFLFLSMILISRTEVLFNEQYIVRQGSLSRTFKTKNRIHVENRSMVVDFLCFKLFQKRLLVIVIDDEQTWFDSTVVTHTTKS